MVAASGFLGAGIQHRERKESDCSRRVGQRNQILHTQTQQRKYQWDICMHRTLCCQLAQHGGHATDISSSDNELYLVIGAFTAHHVLPAAISYPSDHWPASDDPCRILRVIDQDLVSAAANNKIKQSVLSKQSTSCKRRTGGMAGSEVGRSCCSYFWRDWYFYIPFCQCPTMSSKRKE